ncbi:calmodulin-binding family protein [Striga asiatica]|uniref:Calmodulin-binding family protein n=1 Tax=Striga asiatica TaxID=4170 RepID=A0A5A7RFX0_STRAF|nr:calmodulin-binding family protein [Striga asiatica]
MLDPAYEHIVLVHYRDIGKRRENNGSAPQFSTLSSFTFSPSPYSFATDQPESSFVIDESRELYHNESSPSSVEITSVFIENEASNDLENVLGSYENSSRPPNDAVDVCEEMLYSSNDVPNDELQEQFGRPNALSLFIKEADSLEYPAYSPGPHAYRSTPDCYSSLFEQDVLRILLENNISVTISQKQKSSLLGLSYATHQIRVFMIGDTQVPAQLIQEGVLCCHAPLLTCKEKSTSSLLVGIGNPAMLLLSNALQYDDALESRIGLLGRSRNSEDLWSHIIDALLELLKDKLVMWLSYRLQTSANRECSLSKKEQGIIHTVAGLGFEWALQPILNAGVSVNFRDINGWTALHWAARFGREKMVASSASAGAVTSIAATRDSPEMALTTHLPSRDPQLSAWGRFVRQPVDDDDEECILKAELETSVSDMAPSASSRRHVSSSCLVGNHEIY